MGFVKPLTVWFCFCGRSLCLLCNWTSLPSVMLTVTPSVGLWFTPWTFSLRNGTVHHTPCFLTKCSWHQQNPVPEEDNKRTVLYHGFSEKHLFSDPLLLHSLSSAVCRLFALSNKANSKIMGLFSSCRRRRRHWLFINTPVHEFQTCIFGGLDLDTVVQTGGRSTVIL